MFLIRFGRWSRAGGRWFAWERIYFKGYIWTPFVKLEKRISYRKKLESLKSLLQTQGSDGNWNHNEYLYGMFNGMELTLSILENREPRFREPPDVFLETIQGCREANIIGEATPGIVE
jgi:hypothetical protein